jgi:hypothetical protein
MTLPKDEFLRDQIADTIKRSTSIIDPTNLAAKIIRELQDMGYHILYCPGLPKHKISGVKRKQN